MLFLQWHLSIIFCLCIIVHVLCSNRWWPRTKWKLIPFVRALWVVHNSPISNLTPFWLLWNFLFYYYLKHGIHKSKICQKRICSDLISMGVFVIVVIFFHLLFIRLYFFLLIFLIYKIELIFLLYFLYLKPIWNKTKFYKIFLNLTRYINHRGAIWVEIQINIMFFEQSFLIFRLNLC